MIRELPPSWCSFFDGVIRIVRVARSEKNSTRERTGLSGGGMENRRLLYRAQPSWRCQEYTLEFMRFLAEIE